MKEDGKPALVPKLRFPEFRGAKGWKEQSLSGVAMVVMGISPKSEFYNGSQCGLPLLQGNADIKNRLSAPRIFTSEITKECQIGDILMSVRAPVGSIAKSVHHACIGRGIAAIHVKEFNSQEFLYQWLLSYEHRWINISQGGTFDAINSDNLRQLTLVISILAEQQKIAECLSLVDEVIAAQTRKVDVLKTHKKGLMQQLFPREGENQPRLRFPEFRGSWDKKALESLGYFTGGGTPSKDNAAYWTGEIPWISSSDLTEDTISRINISRFITKQAVQESATKLVPAKSILLISRVGVGKLAVSTFPLCTSQDFTNFTPTAADPLFLAYLLKSRKETLLSFNQGTSIKGFTKDNIASLRLGFPSPAEQQKIAECLSSLDALITAETQKLEALKRHKKGLMQQLFPSPEEAKA